MLGLIPVRYNIYEKKSKEDRRESKNIRMNCKERRKRERERERENRENKGKIKKQFKTMII